MPEFAAFSLFLYAAIILIAFGGNLLMCGAIFFDRKLRRQPENLFLVSLAVSDLLISILVMSFAAANDTLGYWPFGRSYCQLWICFDITCTTASILHLSAIALHRFLHISRPLAYFKKRKIHVAIITVWLISASIGFTQIIFDLAQRNVENDEMDKIDDNYNNNNSQPTCELRLKPPYALGSSMCSFFIPATMMVLIYTRLYFYARKHAKIMRVQLKQAADFVIVPIADEHIRKITIRAPEDPDTNPGFIQNELRAFCRCCCIGSMISKRTQTNNTTSTQTLIVTDQKARFTLGVIMGTFLICWLPFFVVNVIRSFFPGSISDVQFEAVTWLGYANSTANPIIYTILNRDFRTAFRKILFDNSLFSNRNALVGKKFKYSRKPVNKEEKAYTVPCISNNLVVEIDS